MAGSTRSLDFEASLSELERVVTELDGDINLEKALDLFDKGMRLSGECERFLKAAEQKVEILKRQADGSTAVEPFESEAQQE